MTTTRPVAIYGAGGFAREVAWLLESINGDSTYQLVGFIEDNEMLQGTRINGIRVFGIAQLKDQFPTAALVVAVGSPQTREKLVTRAQNEGFGFTSLIHPRVERSDWIQVGNGTVICAGSILTTNIVLGEHVQINLDCTVGHDVVMEDYATLAPGVHVSGWVKVGKRAYIGTGATIINGTENTPLIIGDDATVGAGACVTKSIPPGVTAKGIPARW